MKTTSIDQYSEQIPEARASGIFDLWVSRKYGKPGPGISLGTNAKK
jgi:hypothetical protein